MSRQLPRSQREKLVDLSDSLADIQQGLHYVIEIGHERNKRTLLTTPKDLAKRLRNVADRLDGIAPQRAHSEEPEMSHQHLVEDLLRAADNTEQLTARAAKVEDIPLPMRIGITDRLLQLTCLIRLLARQSDPAGEKTANIPIDA